MTAEGIALCTINKRVPNSKLRDLDYLGKELTCLGISQTCIRDQKKELIQSFDDSTQTLPLEHSNRGHEGVSVIIHRLIPYHSGTIFSRTTNQ